MRYLGESLVITFVAFVIAVGLTAIVMPLFNSVTGKNFLVADWLNIRFLGYAGMTMFLVGLLAGSYPAFFTSSIKPLQSLKGKLTGVRGGGFRKVAIIAQFSIAIGLIICTLLIYRQMQFITSYDLGFRKDNIIIIDTPADSAYANTLKIFKESLTKNRSVEIVSNLSYGSVPGGMPSKGTFALKSRQGTKVAAFSRIDENYLPLLGLALIEGRNFDAAATGDGENTVIINESFAKLWGLEKPIGEQMASGREIIGVIKDFHFFSLHNPIEPSIYFYDQQVITNTLVRFTSNSPVSEQIALLKSEWSALFPDQPFVYHFLDESIAALYINEEKTITLFIVFSTLTIIVSCLGLFGLCSLSVLQRKKEVGIRKIVGAGFASIVSLFSKEYLVLISLSFIIVTPVSLWGVNRWLESFPLKGPVSVTVVIVTGMAVTGLGLITIFLSIAKTSRANPADLIRE
jgi:putative ABC transport system permease protein